MRNRGKNMQEAAEEAILNGIKSLDDRITKKYFYDNCRNAYDIWDSKYQLRRKDLDFYSLAHDYYIQLLTHDFKPLLDKPKEVKLSSWMVRGFRFVVLDALKVFNKEFENRVDDIEQDMYDCILSENYSGPLLRHVVAEVETHYNDDTMTRIAQMLFVEGYKQKEVAEAFAITPAAVNLRYKKMMKEVVTPFVIENYGDSGVRYRMVKPLYTPEKERRISPKVIKSLKANDVFVFGSNLKGIHFAGTAKTALLNFGAETGNASGRQGQSYAIPIMLNGEEEIKPYVDEFIEYARNHQELRFFVTSLNYGMAGFECGDIAMMFEPAIELENVYLPNEFWESIPISTRTFSKTSSSKQATSPAKKKSFKWKAIGNYILRLFQRFNRSK